KCRLNGSAVHLLSGLILILMFGGTAALAQEDRPARTSAEPPFNVIFVISDQRNHRLMGGSDYALPAFDAIARHGVSFNNHYIACAMSSPPRAAFLTGRPPQINHVFDQMEYPYTPTLSPDLPNMGSTLKGLGYKTAYFGKFEMDKSILKAEPTVNYTEAI